MDDTVNDQAEAAPALAPDVAELADQGFAIQGQFPANHRLRAEALVAANLTSDPDGIIPDDLVTDARDRIAADAAALKEQQAAERKDAGEFKGVKLPKLVELANAEGIALTAPDDRDAVIVDIVAARAARNEG
jgi:hypothetical protein